MAKTYIRDFYGMIIGSIEELPNGDKIARDFYGMMLGKYRKQYDTTVDFYGRILTKGDTASGLVWDNYNKNKNK